MSRVWIPARGRAVCGERPVLMACTGRQSQDTAHVGKHFLQDTKWEINYLWWDYNIYIYHFAWPNRSQTLPLLQVMQKKTKAFLHPKHLKHTKRKLQRSIKDVNKTEDINPNIFCLFFKLIHTTTNMWLLIIKNSYIMQDYFILMCK